MNEKEFNDLDQLNAKNYYDHDKNYYIENYYLDDNELYDQDDYNTNIILYTSED